MTVRMRHPEHGWTHAYSAGEVEALKLNGWVEDVPVSELAEPSVEAVRAQLDAAGITYDRRWGLARLQQALKD